MLKISAAALSDIGRIRAENEDRCICDTELGLYGVADGVGGMPGGAEAAQTAIDALASGFRGERGDADLRRIVERTNRAVVLRGLKISPAFGIATTLTFGHLSNERIAIAHVGDSRCYLSTGGRLRQLTEDHSAANEVRHHRAVPLQEGEDPRALVRCLGIFPPPEPDLIEYPLEAGDRYLFCTDGISQMLDDRTLATLLGAAGRPASVLKTIIEAALACGGRDNATGVLLFVEG